MLRTALIFLTTLISSCQTDSSEIKNCFGNFKIAILNHDGNAGINFVDKKTIEYYSQLLEKVRKLDSSQLEKESFIDRLTILKARHTISKQGLLTMDGKGLLIASINNGITNNGNIKNYTVGKITIKDSLATAEKLSNSKLTPMQLSFSKENNTWKYRMHASSINNVDFRQLEPDKAITEEDYIFNILENISGKKPSAEIWRPIN